MSTNLPTDVAALHSQAARLRSIASAIDERTRRVEQRTSTLDFQGPAGDRFRAAMAARTHRAGGVARNLEELADLLLQRARMSS
jgi:hypothetical protein